MSGGICRPGGLALTDRLFLYVQRYRPEWNESKIRLLDVGCGNGDSVRHLQKEHPAWDVRGIDPLISAPSWKTEPHAEAGRETCGPVCSGRLCRGVAEEIPLPDQSVDILLLECVFGKLKDPEAALTEFLRVLKPEGLLLISDLYRRPDRSGKAEADQLPEKREKAPDPQSTDRSRMKIGTLETSRHIYERLEKTGFHVLELQDVSRVLGDMVAQAIMDGTCRELEQGLGQSLQELKKLRCGYYLCAAERSRVEALVRFAAENSRFYAEHLKDLHSLPFTTAEDIRREPEAFWCVPPKEISRIITLKSSGSTGRPKRIAFTEADLARTAWFFSYGIRSLVRPGDQVMVFMPGPQHDTVGGLLKDGLGRLPAEVTVYGFIEDMDDAAGAAAGMDSLIGVPAQIRTLARTHPELRPRTVLLSADYVPEKTIRQIEALWKCTVFTHWGMSETGYGGGVQCKAREAYHIRDDELILEIIDPLTGEVLPDGEEGELVLTTIRRQAMPLIRYRTGDLAKIVTEPCPCGCLKPRLGKVMGRISDAVFIGNGIVLTMPKLDELLGDIPGLEDFSAVWSEEERRLYVTCRGTCPSEDALRQEILVRLQALLRTSAEAVVREGKVEPSTGTRKRQIQKMG
ncbi:MAG: methyltransferase domain-containing protein [Lachnospiraceae bacterium]|nr:methyltransferase domain-containing protein [Lachnospiraceae bacterium]